MQFSQSTPAVGEYLPAGQAWHTLRSLLTFFPLSHRVQFTVPVLAATFPATHSVQFTDPNLPAR